MYRNPARKNTFGPGASVPVRYEVFLADGRVERVEGRSLPADLSVAVRERRVSRVVVELR
jgi:hypothetical protein